VRLLFREEGVSTIVVVGGSGDYFDVADCVILMDSYIPLDVTDGARTIADKYRSERTREGGNAFGALRNRVPLPGSFDARKGRKSVRISAKGTRTILFGKHTIDLSAVEQIVSASQTRSIADAIIYLRDRYMDGRRNVRELLELLEKDLERKGLDIFRPGKMGDYELPRRYEVAAAMNRLRGMNVLPDSAGE
jgi:predicted ABC-class ATPase